MTALSMRAVGLAFVALASSTAVGYVGEDSPEPVTVGLEAATPGDGEVSMAQGSEVAVTPATGAWVFTIVSDQGAGTPTVTLEQAGETLTGPYSSTLFGEADLTGTAKGTAIAFTVFAEFEGTEQDLDFTASTTGARRSRARTRPRSGMARSRRSGSSAVRQYQEAAPRPLGQGQGQGSRRRG